MRAILDALSVVADPTPVSQLLDPLSHRRTIDGRPYRPLRPIAPDESARFAALLDARVLLDGCRTETIRRLLSPQDRPMPTNADV